MVGERSKQEEKTFSFRLPSNTIRLSSTEYHVMSAIQFDGRLSVPEVARMINSKESAVRYAIDSLRAKQIVYFAPLIDLSLLGFTYYTVAVALASQESSKMEKVRAFIATSQHVVFAREVGGAFQFAITFVARSAHGVNAFCRELEKASGLNVKEKQLAIHLGMAVYRADYLFSKVYGGRECRWGEVEALEQIDQIDHLLLSGISAPNFSSLRDLARNSGVPVSTLEYRLKRLEQKRIVVCYRNIIRAFKLGVHRFWITIQTSEASDAMTKKFFSFCADNPYLRYAAKSIGAWDFELGFDAPTASFGLEIRQQLSDAFTDKILSLTTSNIFHTSRIANYPFMHLPEHLASDRATERTASPARGGAISRAG